MVMLSPTFATIAEWSTPLGAVAIALIALGEFARRALPALWPFPTAAAVLGWLSWVTLSVVTTLASTEQAGTCSTQAGSCPTSLSSALWAFAQPYVHDLVLAVLAAGLGWVAASLWTWPRGRRATRAGARPA